MTARSELARDIGMALGIVIALTLVATACGMARFPFGSSENRPAKTWTVKDGTSRTFQPQQLTPDDRFQCSDGGGAVGVPSPGSGVGNSSGISASTGLDGSVTVRCDPGPPGNL